MAVRLMGNCARCYYATLKDDETGSCMCARYPKWGFVNDANNHFCGEYIKKDSIPKWALKAVE